MPGMDGLQATQRLLSEQPHIAVVILTTYNEDDMLRQGLKAGARGYLLKDTGRQSLFDTLRAAARGETLLKPDILARVLSQAGERRAPAASAAELSERELEVLQAVAHGERSKEIAVRLGISERTVKAHLASIYNKLGVDSRAAAIAVAAGKGLLAHE
jgi:two-component system, NarL family, response regulator YdfI